MIVETIERHHAPVAVIGTDLSPDAEVGTNRYGGQSTKLLARFDLLDHDAFASLAELAVRHFAHPTGDANINAAIRSMKWALHHASTPEGVTTNLAYAQFALHNAVALSAGDLPAHRTGAANREITSRFSYAYTLLSSKALFRLAEVLGYGAVKYAPNNWRAVPVEEHLNHALTHLVASIGGDQQDDHLGHALCRAHMALAVHYQGAPWIIGADGVPRPQEQEAA